MDFILFSSFIPYVTYLWFWKDFSDYNPTNRFLYLVAYKLCVITAKWIIVLTYKNLTTLLQVTMKYFFSTQ